MRFLEMKSKLFLRILKPGGIWVNLGPLLYHYSDVHNEGSVEPTYEDLIIIIKSLGFEILVRMNMGITNTRLTRVMSATGCGVFFVSEKSNWRQNQVRSESSINAAERIFERVLRVP